MKLSTLLFIAAMVLAYTHAPAQDLKKTAPAPETKMEKFTSKTGVFHKFTDSKFGRNPDP